MNQLELVDVMTYRCLPCLRDLLQITDFENTYLRWVSSSWHYDVEGVKWAVENSDVVPTHQLLDTYLSLLDDDADLPLVQLRLERVTSAKVTLSYREHRDGLINGVTSHGGDYPGDGYTNQLAPRCTSLRSPVISSRGSVRISILRVFYFPTSRLRRRSVFTYQEKRKKDLT